MTIRQQNLYLARYFFEGLGNLAKELSPLTNEAALIRMGQGKAEITDQMAREIEKQLDLPVGWMDRDNDSILRTLTSTDYTVLRLVMPLSHQAKEGLVSLLSSMVSAPR